MVSKEKTIYSKVVFKTNQILTLLKLELFSNQDHSKRQVERNVIELRLLAVSSSVTLLGVMCREVFCQFDFRYNYIDLLRWLLRLKRSTDPYMTTHDGK